jgi:hypothetical protein
LAGVTSGVVQLLVVRRIYIMRPKSTITLLCCVFVSLAAAALSIARMLGYIQVHWITVIIACCVGVGSGFMVIKEYFRKPFIREYSHPNWIVENRDERKGVFIKIPKSEHGAGNKPHYTFLDRGFLYGKDFEVVDNDGDLTIYHPESSFSIPYKSFVIRII